MHTFRTTTLALAALVFAAAMQPLALKSAVRDLERDLLVRALTDAKYNRKKAARLLGLTYDQLRGLLRKYKADLT